MCLCKHVWNFLRENLKYKKKIHLDYFQSSSVMSVCCPVSQFFPCSHHDVLRIYGHIKAKPGRTFSFTDLLLDAVRDKWNSTDAAHCKKLSESEGLLSEKKEKSYPILKHTI